jgi:hypothetical protein
VIRLICNGLDGYLFVNGRYIAELDVSARQDVGQLHVATGIRPGNLQSGAATLFSDFTIKTWQTP